jgi:hypothetical protein
VQEDPRTVGPTHFFQATGHQQKKCFAFLCKHDYDDEIQDDEKGRVCSALDGGKKHVEDDCQITRRKEKAWKT